MVVQTTVLGYVKQDERLMKQLQLVHFLGLPHAAIGGGAIRNCVWNAQAEALGQPSVEPSDVDVVYFDPGYTGRDRDKRIEVKLCGLDDRTLWGVMNQARFHEWQARKYGITVKSAASLEDAMRTWVETATCVAVSVGADGELHLIAPYGTDDLLAGVLRPVPDPRCSPPHVYAARAVRFKTNWPFIREASA